MKTNKIITREQRTKERRIINTLLFITKILLWLTLILLLIAILYNNILK